jgi:integrase
VNCKTQSYLDQKIQTITGDQESMKRNKSPSQEGIFDRFSLTKWKFSPNSTRYMAGSILSDQRGNCEKCNGKFVQVYSEEFEYKVPKCEGCGSYPKLFRITLTLPAVGQKDLRYDQKGNRFKKIVDVVGFLRFHHDQIKNKTFDPSIYLSKKQIDKMRVKNFIEVYLKDREAGVSKGQKASPKAMYDMRSVVKNYLIPYFGDLDIRSIQYNDLYNFKLNCKGSERQKIKTLEILRPMLRMAKLHIPGVVVPGFPEMPKSKMREQFIDEESLFTIQENIRRYREPILLAIMYVMRPCEVRALKWKDIDFKAKTITIQRHFSKNVLLPGRKKATSPNDRGYKLTFDLFDEAIEILSNVPRSINPDDFVFRSIHGGPVQHEALRLAWKEAVKNAKLPHITLYEGTRHARASQLLKAGVSMDVIKILLGHTDSRTTERYARSLTISHSDSLREARITQISRGFKKSAEKDK